MMDIKLTTTIIPLHDIEITYKDDMDYTPTTDRSKLF
jgi:hypothetical protein